MTAGLLLLALAGPESLAALHAQPPVRLQADLPHVQGIDIHRNRLWVTSVDTRARKGFLHEFELPSGRLLRTVEIQDGGRFHPGGFSEAGGALWIPVAEYRAKSTSVIQKRNRRTLALEFQFQVPDHIGCLAVTPKYLIGGNWDTRELYIWDHRGRLQRTVPNLSGNAFQDLKWQGRVLAGGGLLADKSGAIDWLAFPSLEPIRRIAAGQTDTGFPYTREGMTIRKGRLYLLPEDGHSRLFIFDLPRRP